jgi:hypothetical protein
MSLHVALPSPQLWLRHEQCLTRVRPVPYKQHVCSQSFCFICLFCIPVRVLWGIPWIAVRVLWGIPWTAVVRHTLDCCEGTVRHTLDCCGSLWGIPWIAVRALWGILWIAVEPVRHTSTLDCCEAYFELLRLLCEAYDGLLWEQCEAYLGLLWDHCEAYVGLLLYSVRHTLGCWEHWGIPWIAVRALRGLPWITMRSLWGIRRIAVIFCEAYLGLLRALKHTLDYCESTARHTWDYCDSAVWGVPGVRKVHRGKDHVSRLSSPQRNLL